MNDICHKSPSCANFPDSCVSCRAMSDVVEHYPYYKDVPMKRPNKLKVKIFNGIYEERVEDVTNAFIEGKDIVDIKYHHCPNSHSVLIIYKED